MGSAALRASAVRSHLAGGDLAANAAAAGTTWILQAAAASQSPS